MGRKHGQAYYDARDEVDIERMKNNNTFKKGKQDSKVKKKNSKTDRKNFGHSNRQGRKNMKVADARGQKTAFRVFDSFDKAGKLGSGVLHQGIAETGKTIRDPNTGNTIKAAGSLMKPSV